MRELIEQFKSAERSYAKDDPRDLYHAVNNGMILIDEIKAKQLLKRG